MLTVDFDRLDLRAGQRLLDMGCGGGRHAFAAVRRGATVVALDYDAAELKEVRATRGAMADAGEISVDAPGGEVNGDALRLPFPDNCFDRIIASEVLEHLWDDNGAIAELVRVLRPGGRMAVTVPTRFPERVSWALNQHYHDTPGGHVRIYRQHELEQQLEQAGLWLRGSHHAHALHSPYWWLKCAYGLDNTGAWPVRRYHDFLVYQIERQPRWVATLDRTLNPVLGKSLVVYTQKVACEQMTADQLSDVEGIVTAADLRDTVDAIASVQLADGNIPWTPGAHTDPWNLVEAAMALDLGGRHDQSRAAYEWLADKQRADGGWHAYYLGDEVEDETLDTNVTCYIATGAWHHHLITDDNAYLRRQWPTVEAAIDFALDFQRETGEIAWRGDDPDDGALLTGSSSIHHSLRCAIAIAERLGHERPDWEVSLGKLAIAIAHRPDVFLDKDRWAMDWYYPILGGVLRGYPADARVAARWGAFVVDGRGIRCVSDRPWVTAAETCEMVMALDAIGNDEHARRLFSWVQFLRADGGGYWTGANFDDEAFHLDGELYPVEQPTWNSAAVVLAADALAGTGPTAGLFRGERLPEGLDAGALLAAGVELADERARNTR